MRRLARSGGLREPHRTPSRCNGSSDDAEPDESWPPLFDSYEDMASTQARPVGQVNG